MTPHGRGPRRLSPLVALLVIAVLSAAAWFGLFRLFDLLFG